MSYDNIMNGDCQGCFFKLGHRCDLTDRECQNQQEYTPKPAQLKTANKLNDYCKECNYRKDDKCTASHYCKDNSLFTVGGDSEKQCIKCKHSCESIYSCKDCIDFSDYDPIKPIKEKDKMNYEEAYKELKESFALCTKELNDLKQQVSQMNILKKQLEEMETLKEKVEDTENLKKRIEILEKTNIEYEKEIKELRASQFTSPISHKSPINKEKKIFESIDLTFKEKPEKIYIKGDIIHDAKELEMLTRKINKFNRKLTLNLLYKATADSDKAIAFHRKCNDAKSTIVLVETDKGKRFGGFTTCSWSGECIDKKDEEAFIFSLDKMKIYENIPEEDAIGCYPKFGPIFLGCQIRIYDEAFKNGGTTFEKGLNYDTEEDYELTDGERQFNVKEIEVYEVIPQ